jgi:hypothetical protein
VWQAMALSLLMFTGGSQFAFIGVIAGGGAVRRRWARRRCWACATRSTACR